MATRNERLKEILATLTTNVFNVGSYQSFITIVRRDPRIIKKNK